MALLALAVAAAVAQSSAEPVGMWSNANDWETDQFGAGAAGYCVTRSKALSANGVTYTIFMTFGARNEVGLSANVRLKGGQTGSFDVDGGGLDLGDLKPRTELGKFIIFNSITRPMFRLLSGDLKSAHSIAFEVGGRRYAAPMADSAAVYGQMLECQESLLGIVVGELR